MKNYGKDYRGGGEKYEYIGEWYETSDSGAKLKKEAVRLGAMLAGMSVLFLAGLSVNNVGNRMFFVLIPFTCLFLPIIYGWMGCAELKKVADRLADASKAVNPSVNIPPEHCSHLRRSEYEQSFRRLVRCAVFACVCAALALVSDGVALFRYDGKLNALPEAVFAGAAAGMLVLGILWMNSARKLKAAVRKAK